MTEVTAGKSFDCGERNVIGKSMSFDEVSMTGYAECCAT